MLHTLKQPARVLVILALFVALIAAVLISRAAQTWQYVVPNQPDGVLYATTFEIDPASPRNDEWELAEGRLAAEMDADAATLRLSVGAASSGLFAPLRWRFADFDVSVRGKAVNGSLNNGYGVIFRQQDRQNYYYFLISSDGYYRLSRVVDGIAKDLSQWIPSEAVNQGLDAENQLRVVGKGDAFQFFINGQPAAMCIPNDANAHSTYDEFTETCLEGQMLTTVTDSAIHTGRLGVMALSLDTADIVIEFQQFIVMNPT